MKNIYVFYGQYYDFDKKEITIGGVQTYITHICRICSELGVKAHVVQTGSEDREDEVGGVHLLQYAAADTQALEKAVEDKLLPKLNVEEDLFLFATETVVFPKLRFPRSIAIQHGISWDIPSQQHRSILRDMLSRSVVGLRSITALMRVSRVVCVDYNYLNWIRTQVKRYLPNFSVIPNFTEIAPRFAKPEDTVKIIFARRLCDYRGTRIFTGAVKRLLQEKQNISITIAGDGPDAAWMKERLAQYPNVEFITYESGESMQVHADKHIAVVPTVGSEGTSLSLLEAMSAQCAVVCSNVGGMTNIVIDGYNGLMISPTEEQLYTALKSLLADARLRVALAEKAYETVQAGFSLEKWQQKWKKLLTEMLQ